MDDDALVKDFMQTWATGFSPLKSSRMEQHLREMLVESRKHGAELAGQDLSSLAPVVLGRVSKRVEELFARLAPPGVAATPALIEKVRLEVVAMIVDELVTAGMREEQAKVLAAFLSMAIKVKAKQ